MHAPIDKILEDLYAIDPSLRESDTDIRVLVSALLDTKPGAVASTSFLADLRTELLFRAEGSKRARASVPSPLSWWLLRLAPLGAVAVIALMLIPERASSPHTSPLYFDTRVQTESQAPDQTFKSMSVEPEISAPVMQNPFIIPSVTLPRPGFAVISTNQGEVLGTSKLLSSGTTVGVHIILSRVPETSESISTALYLDTGDLLFGEDDILYTH